MTITPLHTADAVALSEFLDSPTGHRLAERLKECRPPLGTANDLNQCALMAQEAKGWENCWATLVALSTLRQTQKEDPGYLNTHQD